MGVRVPFPFSVVFPPSLWCFPHQHALHQSFPCQLPLPLCTLIPWLFAFDYAFGIVWVVRLRCLMCGLLAPWGPVEGFQKWQNDVLAAKFVVDVTEPRTEGPRFTTFVTYNLLSTMCTTGVRRRYSDFEWLREVLKYRFHGESAVQAGILHSPPLSHPPPTLAPLVPFPQPPYHQL